MRQETMETEWGTDHYVLMEATEIPAVIDRGYSDMRRKDDRWCGGTFERLRHCAQHGDESAVTESERFLSEIEDQVPMSLGWRNVDDVVGAIPNVPAFLAGHPQCMRRRERATKDTAPLTIFIDLTSGAEIDSRKVARRGIAALALVRQLVEHRAVTLWAGVAQDVGSGSGTVAWRIETAPMDLARAAYLVASPNVARRFGYGLNSAVNRAGGGWPFRDSRLGARTAQQRLERLLGGEVLHVAPLHNNDPMADRPVEWLKGVMHKYVNTKEED